MLTAPLPGRHDLKNEMGSDLTNLTKMFIYIDGQHNQRRVANERCRHKSISVTCSPYAGKWQRTPQAYRFLSNTTTENYRAYPCQTKTDRKK